MHKSNCQFPCLSGLVGVYFFISIQEFDAFDECLVGLFREPYHLVFESFLRRRDGRHRVAFQIVFEHVAHDVGRRHAHFSDVLFFVERHPEQPVGAVLGVVGQLESVREIFVGEGVVQHEHQLGQHGLAVFAELLYRLGVVGTVGRHAAAAVVDADAWAVEVVFYQELVDSLSVLAFARVDSIHQQRGQLHPNRFPLIFSLHFLLLRQNHRLFPFLSLFLLRYQTIGYVSAQPVSLFGVVVDEALHLFPIEFRGFRIVSCVQRGGVDSLCVRHNGEMDEWVICCKDTTFLVSRQVLLAAFGAFVCISRSKCLLLCCHRPAETESDPNRNRIRN